MLLAKHVLSRAKGMIRGNGDIFAHYLRLNATCRYTLCLSLLWPSLRFSALLINYAALERLWKFTRDDRSESEIMMHQNTRYTVRDW